MYAVTTCSTLASACKGHLLHVGKYIRQLVLERDECNQWDDRNQRCNAKTKHLLIRIGRIPVITL